MEKYELIPPLAYHLGSYLWEKVPLGYQSRREATILGFARPAWQHLDQGAVSAIRRPMTQVCSHSRTVILSDLT